MFLGHSYRLDLTQQELGITQWKANGRLRATKERIFSSTYLNWNLLLSNVLKSKTCEQLKKKGISVWQGQVGPHRQQQVFAGSLGGTAGHAKSSSCHRKEASILDVTGFCSKAWHNCMTKVMKCTPKIPVCLLQSRQELSKVQRTSAAGHLHFSWSLRVLKPVTSCTPPFFWVRQDLPLLRKTFWSCVCWTCITWI